MRHDTIEIGLVGKAPRRRDTKRMMRTSMVARQLEVENSAHANDALDEAFAGMTREERPKSLAVVTHLAEQLQALDRQREQLAKLLREIEDTSVAN
jgi:hypothetical protein